MNKVNTKPETNQINCSIDKQNREVVLKFISQLETVDKNEQVFPNDEDEEMETWFVVTCKSINDVTTTINVLKEQVGVTNCKPTAIRKAFMKR